MPANFAEQRPITEMIFPHLPRIHSENLPTLVVASDQRGKLIDVFFGDTNGTTLPINAFGQNVRVADDHGNSSGLQGFE
jgi:hypothetical protein